MHNNYYFLRQLSRQLAGQLTGWTLAACFSQQKDELVLGFFDPARPEEEFYIKALLSPQFCCLHFPDSYQRSRKNTVDLFKSILDKKVTGVRQFVNERSFALLFEGDARVRQYLLLFKMHGNRSNILLFAGEALEEIFRSQLKKDELLKPDTLDRPLHPTYAQFAEQQGALSTLFPTFGAVVKSYLAQRGYDDLALEDKWQLVQQTLQQLEHPARYYLIQPPSGLYLSLLAAEPVVATHTDAIAAINDFFLRYSREEGLSREKNQWLQGLEKKKTQAENYIRKSKQKLSDLQQGTSHEETANILMAHMHQVPAHAESVELLNFYNNQPIRIKLKKNLNAQKNAEVYYRKAKNQKIEIAQLSQNIDRKQEQLEDIQHHLNQLKALQDVKALRRYVKENRLEEKKQQQVQELPYRQFAIDGFTVLVGKNAKSNDALIRQHSHKEDLWLHAKDVTGSHVIVKHQAGKPFPKALIEKAAQLAAYYSKRKTDSLCPVSFTPRKFVRKSKDLAPGQVIVDREETVMVEPMHPF